MGKISFRQGAGSQLHNRREYEKYNKEIPINIDKEKIKDNIVFVDKDIRKAYDEIFGQAIKDYNDKQKRNDRKISNYYDHIQKSKNGEKVFYENVIQWGSMEDFINPQGKENKEKIIEVFKEYIETFDERNPNLKLIGAYLHLDEASPHLHLDYVPVATNYKIGMSKRNSLSAALKQMNIKVEKTETRNNNLAKAWKERERAHLKELCLEKNLVVDKEEKSNRRYYTADEYKTMTEIVKNTTKQLPQQIESKPTLFDKEKVTVNKKDLEQLEHRARLSLIHEKESKNLVNEIKQELKSTKEFTTNQKDIALLWEYSAKEEYEKYQKLYNEQQKLNESYQTLYEAYQLQDKQIKELTAENGSLKAHISDLKQSIEQKVQQAIKPLQEQIKSLTELKTHLENRLNGMCQSLTNVVKAFNLLKYDKGDYRVELTKKQERLFDGLENYAKNWLKEEHKHDMATDIEKHIGISKGIEKEIKALEPKSRGRDLSL